MSEIQSDLSTMATSGTEGSGCCGGEGGGGHYGEVGVLYNNLSYGVQHVYNCVEVHAYCIP